MNFKLRSTNQPDAKDQQKPVHQLQPSSTFSFFTGPAIPEGYPNGYSGGDHDKLRMREEIRREFEKERIREEIIAEEVARRQLLEAEVRNELMMERQMAMRTGALFMPLALQPSCKNMFEPTKTLHRELIGQEEKVVMRGCNLRENRGLSVSPFKLVADSPEIKRIPVPFPEDNKNEVIIVGMPNDHESVSGTKRKLVAPEDSSQHCSNQSKKKVKEEWNCAICEASTTSGRGLAEHIRGKKHRAKEAALVAQKTGANFGLGVDSKQHIIKPVNLDLSTANLSSCEEKKSENIVKEAVDETPETNITSTTSDLKYEMTGDNKKGGFKYRCELCQVRAASERVMNDHEAGKKHLARVVKLCRKSIVDSKASATATCGEKPETKTNEEVVVE